MTKLSSRMFAVLITITALLVMGWQFFDAKLVRSEPRDISTLNQPTIVATAAAPPQLTTATLGGKPVYVLYVTKSEDTILVRCYPGYEPTIAIRAMGNQPKANTQKEGVMACKPSRS